MDYAKIDHDKILNYIGIKGGTCSVKDIREYSGADKLRVYPMLQCMEMDGEIEVGVSETHYLSKCGVNS